MHEQEIQEGWGSRFRAAPMSLVLGVACVLAFGATWGLCGARVGSSAFGVGALWALDACGPTLVDLGALSVASVWLDGTWWRVATAGMLHGSVAHLVLNIWSLWVVGEWAERAWGPWRVLGLFFASSVGGCLASQAWAEAPMVVGASAGIMGLAGALLVARLVAVGEVGTQLRPLSAGHLGVAVGGLVALGFVVPVIAQAGHLGGLGVGAVLGWGLSGRRDAWLGRLAGLVLLGALGFAAARPGWRLAHDELLGYELLERGRSLEAVEKLERVMRTRPEDVGLANDVAYGYAKAGIELDRAERLVGRALAEEPDNASYLDTLGWIRCRAGDPEGGLVHLEAAVRELDDPDPEIEAHVRDCADAAVAP